MNKTKPNQINIINQISTRPKGFLKLIPNSTISDDIVEDLSSLNAVVNCESYSPQCYHWDKDHKGKYDFLVYVRKEDFVDTKTIKDYSEKYNCSIGIIGFRIEGRIEYEEIIFEAIANI